MPRARCGNVVRVHPGRHYSRLRSGIGGTVAIFSALYAVLYRPLLLVEAERLVVPVSVNLTRGIQRGGVCPGAASALSGGTRVARCATIGRICRSYMRLRGS